jgi:hypothetical protein
MQPRLPALFSFAAWLAVATGCSESEPRAAVLAERPRAAAAPVAVPKPESRLLSSLVETSRCIDCGSTRYETTQNYENGQKWRDERIVPSLLLEKTAGDGPCEHVWIRERGSFWSTDSWGEKMMPEGIGIWPRIPGDEGIVAAQLAFASRRGLKPREVFQTLFRRVLMKEEGDPGTIRAALGSVDDTESRARRLLEEHYDEISAVAARFDLETYLSGGYRRGPEQEREDRLREYGEIAAAGGLVIEGPLSRRSVKRALSSIAQPIARCFEMHPDTTPDGFRGSVGIWFFVTNTGRVPVARTLRQTAENEQLGLCLADVVKSLRFPARKKPELAFVRCLLKAP